MSLGGGPLESADFKARVDKLAAQADAERAARSPPAIFGAKRPAAPYNDRAVVATDRRLLLLELNYFGSVTGLVREVPRAIKLGPCGGVMHPISAVGTPLAVSSRFFKDVAEAVA